MYIVQDIYNFVYPFYVSNRDNFFSFNAKGHMTCISTDQWYFGQDIESGAGLL